MRFFRCARSVILIFLILLYAESSAAEKPKDPGRFGPPTGWTSFARGGSVYQFDTDLDEAGSYSATRFTIQAGQGYAWDRRTSISLSLGYSYDGYSFSSGIGTASFAPWEDIHSFSLGLPIRKGFGDAWAGFLIPSLRSSGEGGATFNETITGGVLTGVAYRFSDRLTLGPGIGVISQLEESATVFPVIIIDWKITDRLSLTTGRGLGATLGPGLTLNYKANRSWKFALGGRYEKLRFRLDHDGAVADGVGEDTSFPLFTSCTYSFDPKTQLSLVGGIELGGDLVVEDEKGNEIRKESYDPGGFLGVTFRVRI